MQKEFKELQSFLSDVIFLSFAHTEAQEPEYQEKVKKFAIALSHSLLARSRFSQNLEQDTVEELLALIISIAGLAHFAGETNFVNTSFDKYGI